LLEIKTLTNVCPILQVTIVPGLLGPKIKTSIIFIKILNAKYQFLVSN